MSVKLSLSFTFEQIKFLTHNLLLSAYLDKTIENIKNIKVIQ